MRTAPYGSTVQAPRKLAYFDPLSRLPILNTRTCKDHMFLDTNLDKKTSPSITAHKHSTPDRNPPREESLQCKATSRRRETKRSASIPRGPATDIFLAREFS